MPTVVLSPHPDDAVLSCWRLLAGPGDVTVLNVFTGVPGASEAARPAWWDRLTGAVDGAARMRERLAEDARALGLAGRTAAHLGFLDDQYRQAPQSPAEIADAIAPLLAPGVRVFAPAGLGGIADHDLVREAALDLERRGHDVAFYADLPHAIRFGWPASVTGGDGVDGLDVEAYWTATLDRAVPAADSLARDVHVLDADALAAKLAAIRTYRTQLPALLALNGRLEQPSSLRYEATWRR
jgi:LmbE family N-acetylglucosaminyl deacetylase